MSNLSFDVDEEEIKTFFSKVRRNLKPQKQFQFIVPVPPPDYSKVLQYAVIKPASSDFKNRIGRVKCRYSML